MENDFFYIALDFLSGANLFLAFLTATALTIALSVTFSVLALKNTFLNGKNFTFLSVCVCFLAVLSALSLINTRATTATEKIFFPLLYLGVASTAFIPVKLTKGKLKIKQEQIDLVRLIDRESERQPPRPPVSIEKPVIERKPTQKLQAKPLQPAVTEQNDEIDFSHVKNVIERLNYFNLAPSDKRIVNELTANVSLAEQGEFSPDLKGKINDGLGSLLKIMSKYGV